MTRSELHAIMTGGFATTTGRALAIYISFGVSSLAVPLESYDLSVCLLLFISFSSFLYAIY